MAVEENGGALAVGLTIELALESLRSELELILDLLFELVELADGVLTGGCGRFLVFDCAREDLDDLAEAGDVLFELMKEERSGVVEDAILGSSAGAEPPSTDKVGHGNAEEKGVNAEDVKVVGRVDDPFWDGDAGAELLLAVWVTVKLEVAADSFVGEPGRR